MSGEESGGREVDRGRLSYIWTEVEKLGLNLAEIKGCMEDDQVTQGRGDRNCMGYFRQKLHRMCWQHDI